MYRTTRRLRPPRNIVELQVYTLVAIFVKAAQPTLVAGADQLRRCRRQ